MSNLKHNHRLYLRSDSSVWIDEFVDVLLERGSDYTIVVRDFNYILDTLTSTSNLYYSLRRFVVKTLPVGILYNIVDNMVDKLIDRNKTLIVIKNIPMRLSLKRLYELEYSVSVRQEVLFGMICTNAHVVTDMSILDKIKFNIFSQSLNFGDHLAVKHSPETFIDTVSGMGVILDSLPFVNMPKHYKAKYIILP